MRLVDADWILNHLPDDLLYKDSVKRVLIMTPTVDIAKKIFNQINMRFNEAIYEMENFINTCKDSDACADCQDRLDGLTYGMAIIDEVQEQIEEDKINEAD